jgi:prolyl oligopeptidase PreP (S9A serine peptidase family)
MVRETTKQRDARNWAKDMAKETKAERQERERQAEVNRLAEQAREYPARLMAAFARLNNQYDMEQD